MKRFLELCWGYFLIVFVCVAPIFFSVGAVVLLSLINICLGFTILLFFPMLCAYYEGGYFEKAFDWVYESFLGGHEEK